MSQGSLEKDLAEGRSTADLSPEERREWMRLVGSVRRLVEASVALDAPPGALAGLAAEAEALAARLESHARPEPIDHMAGRERRALAGHELDAMLPFSPITGRLNPVAPPLRMSGGPEGVEGRVRLGSACQGAPGLAHGAVVAGIWDEVLAMATVTHGLVGPTAFLNIKYRRPTRLYVDLRFEATLERAEERRVFARGRCLDGDEVVTMAEAMFVRIDPDDPPADWSHFRR